MLVRGLISLVLIVCFGNSLVAQPASMCLMPPEKYLESFIQLAQCTESDRRGCTRRYGDSCVKLCQGTAQKAAQCRQNCTDDYKNCRDAAGCKTY